MGKTKFISRAKELLRSHPDTLGRIKAAHTDDDVEKHQWRAYQDKKETIRDILQYEFAG